MRRTTGRRPAAASFSRARLRTGRRTGALAVALAAFVVGTVSLITASGQHAAPAGAGARPAVGGVASVIPRPASVVERPGSFQLDARTRIVAGASGRDAAASTVARQLADLLRPATGLPLPVVTQPVQSAENAIELDLSGGGGGPESYRLDVTPRRVRLSASTTAGLFYGVQTLRQLLPAAVEHSSRQPGPWRIPAVRIADRPRFTYRGVMLDVARHFLTVADVQRYIDLISMYKMNTLHLHLSDDQGWRIAIDGWPRLATYGGSTGVGNSQGGFYTKRDYATIVRYAADRHVDVVPEIDTPGHSNAALASYPGLNCDGLAPPLYTGTSVGFSSLCAGSPATDRLLSDVIGAVSAMSPGPIYHLGGDEAKRTRHDDYVRLVDRAAALATANGKRVMAWEEGAAADLPRDSIVEYWNAAGGSAPGTEVARTAVAKGLKLVMAPASRAYLDMKYDADTPLGQDWAGLVDVRTSYSWDPVTFVDGITEADVLGVEAPIWGETLPDTKAVDAMAFPRLPGIAEIGWSPAATRSWDRYRFSLAAQGPRWDALGVGYYRSEEVPWPPAD